MTHGTRSANQAPANMTTAEPAMAMGSSTLPEIWLFARRSVLLTTSAMLWSSAHSLHGVNSRASITAP
jgi:hypothetical protein